MTQNLINKHPNSTGGIQSRKYTVMCTSQILPYLKTSRTDAKKKEKNIRPVQ